MACGLAAVHVIGVGEAQVEVEGAGAATLDASEVGLARSAGARLMA